MFQNHKINVHSSHAGVKSEYLPHGRLLLKSIGKSSPIVWAIFDVVIALIALKLAYTYAPKASKVDILTPQIFFFPVLILIAGTISGLYEREVFLTRTRILLSLTGMILLSIITLALFTNIVVYQQIGRYVMISTAGLMFIGSGIIRIAGYHIAKVFKIRILLIGDHGAISPIAREIRKQREHYSLTGFCDINSCISEDYLGTIEELPSICEREKVDLIVISTDYVNQAHILDHCFKAVRMGCRILDECTFYEHFFEMVLVDKLDPSWFYSGKLDVHKNLQAIVKRLMDIMIGTSGLIITLPVLPLIWVLIRLTSWGPAIYSQVRCGQFGRPFKIYKFRTMFVESEKNGPEWAGKKDRRITPFGYFLRKTRLDEIPQFLNMIKGDMSFVGPRPERPELVSLIEKDLHYFPYRNLAKPGLTGLAQIKYRYGASIDDAKKKLQYDLYYIKNWSIFLDIQIILRTFTALIKGSR